ncbi:hypothetical protein BCR33DRAFT_720463 [Rhizoclosmatium globosum]|uniref:Extracellular membrane protein CFEM domain-containing protein n=1 Tax=Rhizoclosmatium globosum TaxID=329046 RepID=A0A1Y2BVJ3_9FUNG|nr:hypothetical protein BCR33DRAFT_720463 [Rhizoclosmatium globosum]|eukprot:ORY38780.1 hypothetical protein BCR33DRAFT_720463 [Rhizoclosmatium globosum]
MQSHLLFTFAKVTLVAAQVLNSTVVTPTVYGYGNLGTLLMTLQSIPLCLLSCANGGDPVISQSTVTALCSTINSHVEDKNMTACVMQCPPADLAEFSSVMTYSNAQDVVSTCQSNYSIPSTDELGAALKAASYFPSCYAYCLGFEKPITRSNIQKLCNAPYSSPLKLISCAASRCSLNDMAAILRLSFDSNKAHAIDRICQYIPFDYSLSFIPSVPSSPAIPRNQSDSIDLVTAALQNVTLSACTINCLNDNANNTSKVFPVITNVTAFNFCAAVTSYNHPPSSIQTVADSVRDCVTNCNIAGDFTGLMTVSQKYINTCMDLVTADASDVVHVAIRASTLSDHAIACLTQSYLLSSVSASFCGFIVPATPWQLQSAQNCIYRGDRGADDIRTIASISQAPGVLEQCASLNAPNQQGTLAAAVGVFNKFPPCVSQCASYVTPVTPSNVNDACFKLFSANNETENCLLSQCSDFVIHEDQNQMATLTPVCGPAIVAVGNNTSNSNTTIPTVNVDPFAISVSVVVSALKVANISDCVIECINNGANSTVSDATALSLCNMAIPQNSSQITQIQSIQSCAFSCPDVNMTALSTMMSDQSLIHSCLTLTTPPSPIDDTALAFEVLNNVSPCVASCAKFSIPVTPTNLASTCISLYGQTADFSCLSTCPDFMATLVSNNTVSNAVETVCTPALLQQHASSQVGSNGQATVYTALDNINLSNCSIGCINGGSSNDSTLSFSTVKSFCAFTVPIPDQTSQTAIYSCLNHCNNTEFKSVVNATLRPEIVDACVRLTPPAPPDVVTAAVEAFSMLPDCAPACAHYPTPVTRQNLAQACLGFMAASSQTWDCFQKECPQLETMMTNKNMSSVMQTMQTACSSVIAQPRTKSTFLAHLSRSLKLVRRF